MMDFFRYRVTGFLTKHFKVKTALLNCFSMNESPNISVFSTARNFLIHGDARNLC